ncbi:hypothetical protein C2E23DRAFT_823624 [Lenzites betulinus]|nr:hypothetical protein C2E23DRAFT_823624 [Lenzites betulinus]
MSADTVARWNAIPLNRPNPDQSAQQSLKRTRTDEDDHESDDDVSLISRSPSPPPPDAMDVDKYDEYYTKTSAREVITVETRIKSNNIGFSMLEKMGWKEGSPLGLSGDGRVDPIPFYVKNDLTGLGKSTQDVRMIETTVSQRRELDSERQIKETEEQRKQREEAVARRAAVQSELSTVLRPFYCEVCEKQFQNVAQYDEHTNSYAHHHKVRFRDMQASQRASRNTKEEIDKRKEKERKREEKELRKIAKAAGVKMTKPPVALAPVEGASASAEPKPSGFKKSGWATVTASGPSGTAPPPPAEPPRQSGWGSASNVQAASSSAGAQGGWAPAAPNPTPSSAAHPPGPPVPPTHVQANYNTAPAFRTGGWTSLETGGAVPPPPPSPVPPQHAPPPPGGYAPAPPPPPTMGPQGGWAQAGAYPGAGGWQNAQPAGHPPPPPPASFGGPPGPPPVAARPPPPSAPNASRSGWQNFRAGAPGRRR